MLVKDVLKKKLFEISRLNKEGFKINVMTVGVHKAGPDNNMRHVLAPRHSQVNATSSPHQRHVGCLRGF